MEELDSDDEEEEPDDDPLADAALMVRKLIQNASNKTSDVHARAQEATEEYKCATQCFDTCTLFLSGESVDSRGLGHTDG